MPESWRKDMKATGFLQSVGPPRCALRTLARLLILLLAVSACGRQQTGELPPTGFKVVFESHSVPKEMKVGEQTNAEVRIRNASSITWPSKPNEKKKFEVQFSYHWLTSKGEMVTFDGLRTALPHDLKPGTSVALRPAIQAPPRAGSYLLELTLVQEGKAWFPEIDDDNKVAVPVTVTDGKPSGDRKLDGRGNVSSGDAEGKAKKNRREKKRESRTTSANNERTGGDSIPDGSWALQVAAYPEEKDAKDLATRLKEMGYDAFVVKGELKNRSWYRVRVGRLKTRQEAENLKAKLLHQKPNQEFLVVQNR
jgi:hypothetical protein